MAHTPQDMGSLAPRLPGGKTYSRVAEARWRGIRAQVQGLRVDWSQVKVYQDGLPDAGPGIIQRVLAEVQSANYDLLRWLVTQGAELLGTESPSLTKEEYTHLQAVLTATDAAARVKARQAYAERAAALLDERDAYIAGRIAETLTPGGLGLLFIGQMHDVARHLPVDIAVRELPDSRATTRSRTTQQTETRDRDP